MKTEICLKIVLKRFDMRLVQYLFISLQDKNLTTRTDFDDTLKTGLTVTTTCKLRYGDWKNGVT